MRSYAACGGQRARVRDERHVGVARLLEARRHLLSGPVVRRSSLRRDRAPPEETAGETRPSAGISSCHGYRMSVGETCVTRDR